MLRSLGFVVLSLVASTAFAERTALQKHADFFDGNGNNIVTVPETYDGLRRLGIDPVRSSAFAVAINLGLGRSTGAAWYEPYNVYLDAIEKGKHSSDTDIYDDIYIFTPTWNIDMEMKIVLLLSLFALLKFLKIWRTLVRI